MKATIETLRLLVLRNWEVKNAKLQESVCAWRNVFLHISNIGSQTNFFEPDCDFNFWRGLTGGETNMAHGNKRHCLAP